MIDEEMTWDDLDKDQPTQTPGDVVIEQDDAGNPIIPTPLSDDPLDDESFLMETPKRDADKGDDDGDGNADENDDKNKDKGTNQSGIELYLSQFDIEGGMISFDDGTSKHFDELPAEKQSEILQQLHGNQAISIEEKYGLADSEIGVINYLRENKITMEQMIESMAMERVNTLMAMNQSTAVDYSTMSDDGIYTKFLKSTNSELTTEQIEAKLQEAKKLDTFSNVTDALRTQYKTIQDTETATAKREADKKASDSLESQRATVVNSVRNVNDMAGIQLNDNIKNSVLDRVLNVDESGDSLFMTEVFSDPTNLFKAAFWYYYGETVSKQRDEYWKKEKSSAYKRGKADALGTTPSQRVSFTAGTQQKTPPVGTKTKQDADWQFDD